MTSTTMAQVGWFPDPHVTGVLRYYDGERWTEHTLATPAPLAAAPLIIPTQANQSAAMFWESTGNVLV